MHAKYGLLNYSMEGKEHAHYATIPNTLLWWLESVVSLSHGPTELGLS